MRFNRFAFVAATLLAAGLLSAVGCGTEKEYAGNLVETYDKARATGTAAEMKVIGTALSAYRLDHGDYPAVSGIDALAAELGPDYLRLAVTQDKWGRPLKYSAGPGRYRLVSTGEDGLEGTADDLVFEDGRLTQAPPGFGPSF